MFDDLDDAETCGALPLNNTSYVVCNHESGEWEEFDSVNAMDNLTCGDKPEGMLNAVCNLETSQWEAVGVVHSPEDPICGTKPAEMTDYAVCDAATAEWQELIVVETGTGAGCAGEPPADLKLAICDTETGLWQEDYIALDNTTYESAFLDQEEEIEIAVDPLTGEFTIEEVDPIE